MIAEAIELSVRKGGRLHHLKLCIGISLPPGREYLECIGPQAFKAAQRLVFLIPLGDGVRLGSDAALCRKYLRRLLKRVAEIVIADSVQNDRPRKLLPFYSARGKRAPARRIAANVELYRLMFVAPYSAFNEIFRLTIRTTISGTLLRFSARFFLFANFYRLFFCRYFSFVLIS